MLRLKKEFHRKEEPELGQDIVQWLRLLTLELPSPSMLCRRVVTELLQAQGSQLAGGN